MRFLCIFLIFMFSCTHSDKKKNDRVIESIDGRIKTKHIILADPHSTKIEKLLKSAYINYKNVDFDKAITNFETIILINGTLDFWHQYTLAYCYLSNGSFKKSEEILNKLVEDKPEIADTYVLLGLNYLKLDKIDKSLELFNKAFSLENHTLKTYFYLMHAKKLKNDTDLDAIMEKAEEEYKEILSKNPNDFETLIEASNLHARFGKPSDARNYLDQATATLEISPEIEEKTYSQSQAPYQNPIWTSFYLSIIEGKILNKEKKFQQSNEMFLIALQTPSGSKLDLAEIYYYMSINFKELNDEKSSKKALELAIELDPTVTKIY